MKRQWYNNGIEELLIREPKLIPAGFIPGRLLKQDTALAKLSQQVSKEELYNLYIIENKSFETLVDLFNVKRGLLKRLLNQYDIHKDPKARAKNNTYKRTPEQVKAVALKSSETQKKNWANRSSLEKELWSEKQKNSRHTQEYHGKQSKIIKEAVKKAKEADPEKFEIRNTQRSLSCKKTWQGNKALIEQQKLSAKKNRLARKNQLCRTKAEQKLYETLIKIYSDLQYDVKVNDKYPYYCDFYIPSLELFIELQAHPSHGRLPINKLSVDEYSKYSAKWVDVFARRDVEKINKAKKNNINLIRIYPRASLKENLELNEYKFLDLVEICYYSQK